MESDRAGWVQKARRLGPQPYSERGPVPLAPPAPLEELAGWVVDTVDSWWEGQGRPDPYVVVVVSGDDGPLARRVLGLGPAALTAMRYVMVHPVIPVRAHALGAGGSALERAGALVPLEEPAFLFPSAGRPGSTGPPTADRSGPGLPGHPRPGPDRLEAPGGDDWDEVACPAVSIGPLVAMVGELPTLATADVAVAVIAVEALSRLPFDVFEWSGGEWTEVRVAVGPDDEELVEVRVPLARDQHSRLASMPTTASEGDRYAVLTAAGSWLRGALRCGASGTLAVVDTWTDSSTPMSPSGELPPLALDQLRRVREPLDRAPGDLFGGLAVVRWPIG